MSASQKLNDSHKTASLPLVLRQRVPCDTVDAALASNRWKKPLLWVAIVVWLVAAGGALGMYFQPPGLQLLFQVIGLEPGGGSKNPMAIARQDLAQTEASGAAAQALDVVALGRLLPAGNVVTVATPFGAGDARLQELLVAKGDTVQKGQRLGVMDNVDPLKAGVNAARANVAAREASLAQARETTLANLAEAEASLARAYAASAAAAADLKRSRSLFQQGMVSQAAIDQAQSTAAQAAQEVRRMEVTVNRYRSNGEAEQVDVLVALRNLELSRAELERSEADLQRAYIVAPSNGTVLDIHTRPGEKPDQTGILSIGNIRQMHAELEVYQNDIGRIRTGNLVTLIAEPLGQELTGRVTSIGLEVDRQTVLRDDPAANTDARVIRVQVVLTPESSEIAARFTNLQIVGRISLENRQADVTS